MLNEKKTKYLRFPSNQDLQDFLAITHCFSKIFYWETEVIGILDELEIELAVNGMEAIVLDEKLGSFEGYSIRNTSAQIAIAP